MSKRIFLLFLAAFSVPGIRSFLVENREDLAWLEHFSLMISEWLEILASLLAAVTQWALAAFLTCLARSHYGRATGILGGSLLGVILGACCIWLLHTYPSWL